MTSRTSSRYTGGTTGTRTPAGRSGRSRNRASASAWPKPGEPGNQRGADESAWDNSAPDAAAARASILIVDDNDNVALFMQEVLEDAGYNVGTVNSVNSARQYLARVPVDLLILDWHLGARSGAELLDTLPQRNGVAFPATIVATGSRPGSADGREALRRGAMDTLLKPSSVEAFKDTVAACLSAAKARARG